MSPMKNPLYYYDLHNNNNKLLFYFTVPLKIKIDPFEAPTQKYVSKLVTPIKSNVLITRVIYYHKHTHLHR